MRMFTPEQIATMCELRDGGLSLRKVAAVFGVSHTSIRWYTDAEYREKDRRLLARKEWYARNRERCYASARRSRIRREARQEAAETGTPVNDVYARWGVLLAKDTAPRCPPSMSTSKPAQPST
jgi:hypothetical protein